MELRHYLTIARRWWLTLALAGALAGVAGYVVASRVSETFEATARLVVGPATANLETIQAARSHVPVYAELITSLPVVNGVIEDLELPIAGAELQRLVRASADSASRVITVSVQSNDPDVAAAIADGLVTQLNRFAGSDAGTPAGLATLVEPAEPPLEPIAPRVNLLAAMAAFAGLLGAVLVVIVVEYLGDAIRDRSDLARWSGLPVLGSVEAWQSPDGSGIAAGLPESRVAVSYQLLARALVNSKPDLPVRIIVVVGSEAGDAAGEVALNLATVLQYSNRSVLLVDANDEEREISARLGLDGRPGLSEILAGERHPIDRILWAAPGGIRVLPAGGGARAIVVGADQARATAGIFQKHADTVLIHAAPVHGSASSLVWARVADTVVLTARRGHTQRKAVQHAVESLRGIGAKIPGTILLEPARSRFGPRPARSRRISADASGKTSA